MVIMKIFSPDCTTVRFVPDQLLFTPTDLEKTVKVIYNRIEDKERDYFTVVHKTYSEDYNFHALRVEIQAFVIQSEGNNQVFQSCTNAKSAGESNQLGSKDGIFLFGPGYLET